MQTQVTFADKIIGPAPAGKWRFVDANEVKNALNANATDVENYKTASDAATVAAQATADAAIPAAEKGVANGVATLDGSGLIPSAQLPSYVDDVIEVADFASLPVTGEAGKIYVTLDNNKQYRWATTVYVQVSVSDPAGADTQIQFNNGGAFGGSSLLTWDGTSLAVGNLNSGDNIITTDASGNLQESGAKVETTAEAGSILSMVNFTTSPTAPIDGDAWFRVEGGLTYLDYRVAGVTKSVELS